MELPAYFLCDAHLGIDPPGCVPDREAMLVCLLKTWVGKASHVVIVGDLFEFWYEYRYYVASAHMELYRVLAELVQSGVQVHLLRGNHDFAALCGVSWISLSTGPFSGRSIRMSAWLSLALSGVTAVSTVKTAISTWMNIWRGRTRR